MSSPPSPRTPSCKSARCGSIFQSSEVLGGQTGGRVVKFWFRDGQSSKDGWSVTRGKDIAFAFGLFSGAVPNPTTGSCCATRGFGELLLCVICYTWLFEQTVHKFSESSILHSTGPEVLSQTSTADSIPNYRTIINRQPLLISTGNNSNSLDQSRQHNSA